MDRVGIRRIGGTEGQNDFVKGAMSGVWVHFWAVSLSGPWQKAVLAFGVTGAKQLGTSH